MNPTTRSVRLGAIRLGAIVLGAAALVTGAVLLTGDPEPAPRSESIVDAGHQAEPLADRNHVDGSADDLARNAAVLAGETVGLATADDRVRVAARFAVDSLRTELDWDPQLGPPALLWSDRRASRLLTVPASWPPADGAFGGPLELSRGQDVDCTVGGLDDDGVVTIVCAVPGASPRVHVLGSTVGGVLRIVGLEAGCRIRAIDPIDRRLSAWGRPSDADPAALALKLELPAHESRILTEGDERAVAGAEVEARDADGHVVDRATSLVDGRAFWHPTRTADTLVADRPGHASAVVPARPGSQTIRLPPARDLVVDVSRDQADGPARAVDNAVLQWAGPWLRRARLDDGRALFRDLPLEAVELQLLEGSRRSSCTVPAELEEFHWRLAAATTLRGRLTSRWTDDVRFVVLLGQGKQAARPLFPDDAGLFEAGNVPDEELQLEVVAVFGPGHEIVVRRLTAHPDTFVEIGLTAEHLPGSSLSGELLDSTGARVPATVRLRRVDPEFPRTASTFAEEGRFAFERLQAGDYVLEAQPGDWPVPAERRILVRPGENPPFAWTLPETVSLAVGLEGAVDGLEQARLMLRPVGTDDWSASFTREDPKAAFELGNLVPGRYQFQIAGAPQLAPRLYDLVVRAEASAQEVTFGVERGVPCELQVTGLDWGRTECELTATGRDGAMAARIYKHGDSAHWQVTLAPGRFDLQFRRGHELRRSTVEVEDLGGAVHLHVHAW